MNAFIFPGQGSQKVGMGRVLHESEEVARQFFDRASLVLGYDLARLCFDGPEEKLTDTIHAQPALLTLDIAAHEVALHKGLSPQMLAGHSLGEYAALVAAKVLSFEDALKLVEHRAQLMSAAPAGRMAAIIGLPDAELPRVLEEVQSEGLVVAANFNSPGQIVLSGTAGGVDAAMQEAKKRGAKMAVALPVSGAFHSPLMREAGEELNELIDATPFRAAQIPVYQNATAQTAVSIEDLKAALKLQMTGAVLWTQTVQNMIADGATHFYEMGPGKVLSGLIKRIDKTVSIEAADA
jgi:[acyl-carrier-protein] S-malonyltransferase